MESERIGKYRVIGRLGQGGMASVLLTVVQGPGSFQKLLVVKELREELAADPDFLAMFRDEARLAARLNHPNIVQTYEVGEELLATATGPRGRYYLAMEYLEGQPLHVILRRVGRPNFPLELHFRILSEVLSGLEYAHNLTDFDDTPLGIVHRDVSPQNVFVTYDGQTKLVDFGIAKAVGATSTTKEGVFKGKLSYIAPEQIRCESIDARADVFAVGVMLWEAIAGRRIGQGEDERSLMARRMSGRDPPIETMLHAIHPDLAEITNRAMAPDPKDRFPSAGAFQDALENYLATNDSRASTKDVASFVTSTFAAERTHVRGLVDQQMKKQPEEARNEVIPGVGFAGLGSTMQLSGTYPMPPAFPQSVIPQAPPIPLMSSEGLADRKGPLSETPAANPILHTTGTHPVERRRSPALYVGLAAGAAAVAGAIVFFSSRETPPKSEPAAGTTASEPSVTASPSAKIKVRIDYPEGAKATLDGGEVTGNPFSAELDADSAIHRFEVTMDGFQTEKRTLMFDKDIALAITLEPLAKGAAPARPQLGYGPRVIKPKASASAPEETDPPKRQGPKPGVDIDEQNPYRKKP